MKTLAAYGNHCNQSLLLFHPAEWFHKQKHIQYIISRLDEYLPQALEPWDAFGPNQIPTICVE